MASTNKTTNYALPQWVGTDRPSFADDFNPAFLTIDSSIATAEQMAATAVTSAGTAETAANEAKQAATSAGTIASAVNEEVKTVKSNLTTKVALTCDLFDSLFINNYNQDDTEATSNTSTKK